MEQSPSDVTPTRPQLVLATFDERTPAAAAVNSLRERGVPDASISVVVRHDTPEISAEEMAALDKQADAIGTDVAVGSMAGGVAGFLTGLALFSIPGLGPFLGIGVLAGTLGGAALGSALGDRVAHLSTLGIPEERASRYHTALESGHVVVAITAPDAQTVMIAREILASNGAEEIDVHPYGLDTSTVA
jgi:hypothetical protein